MSLSAAEVRQQLSVLEEAARARSPGELGRVEQLTREFLHLGVTRSAEILDVAAGSGILSAKLQQAGYTSLDALDGDLPTLRSLQALRLYRNYIHSTVAGILSTGTAPYYDFNLEICAQYNETEIKGKYETVVL